MDNLVAMLAASVQAHGPRPLFGTRGPGGWSWTTYAEFGARVAAMRAGLASLGVARGDRVAVISRNRVEWAVGFYATVGLGAAYVPMYEAQHEREWRHILSDSGATVCLISGAAVGPRFANVAVEVPALRQVVDFDAPVTEPSSYAALLEEGQSRRDAVSPPAGGDLAEIIYTSGTTGNPKGVRLTHANIVSNIAAVTSILPITREDRTLAFLPWSHVFGANELHGVISLGASMGLCESPDLIAAELPEVKPTLLFAVPRIWTRVYQGVQRELAAKPRALRRIVERATSGLHRRRTGQRLGRGDRAAVLVTRALVFSRIRRLFGGRLRFAVSAAAALAPEVAEFIDDLGIVVLEAYGLTESSACATINRPGERRIGSVGKPIPGVRVALDTSVPGAEGGAGEIVIHGHCVMAGYHNLPEETARTLTADGGLRTGDLGRFDADGFLYVTGRIKDLYKLDNGKYVAPALLEEQLTLSPFIDQAFVHGANRPFNVALLVTNRQAVEQWARARGSDAPFDALQRDPDLRGLIQAEMTRASVEFKGFETISAFALLSEPFTIASGLLTPTLKVKRPRVLDRHRELLASLYRSVRSESKGAEAPVATAAPRPL